jgi:lipid-A-disaccharide synthase
MNADSRSDLSHRRVDLLIIAGEHSGDQHAAAIIKELRVKHPELNICAFGGRRLSETGIRLVLNMTKFSVVGIIEVASKYFFFRKLLGKIVAWIERHKPLVVCFVDYPGLNIRIARALFEKKLSTKSGGDIKLLYYISPQIWAWKRKRKFELERYVDSLGTIFEFEKAVYEDTKLDVKYVGHPFAKVDMSKLVSYEENGPILLLPGSRESAIGKIFPKMLGCFSKLSEQEPEKMATIIYASDRMLAIMRRILNKKFKHLANKVSFIPDGKSVEACAALMSSGTMSLKCCLAGLPGVILYRSNYVTFVLARLFIKLEYIGMANILLNRLAWPEFIQHAISEEVVSRYLVKCVNSTEIREKCKDDAETLCSSLCKKPEISPDLWLYDAIASQVDHTSTSRS